MIEQIAGLADQVVAVLAHRRQHGLDRFLAELLGALGDAAVEQLARIGGIGARAGALLHPLFQVVKCEISHAFFLSPRRAGREGVNHASSRIGSPARAMCCLAWRSVNSPKLKIGPHSTGVASPSRLPRHRWSSLPAPPRPLPGTDPGAAPPAGG